MHTRPRFKLAVFDLDGTLADSLPTITKAVNVAMDEARHPHYAEEEVREMIGEGHKILLQRAIPNVDSHSEHFANVCSLYEKTLVGLSSDVCAFPGATALLRRLLDAGILCAVVSNKPTSSVTSVLNVIFAEDGSVVPRLVSVVGADGTVPLKPDPSALLSLIDRLQLTKREVVFIGDSHVDVQTAVNAGVECIGCTWGYGKRDHFVSCALIANGLEDIGSLILEQ